MRSLTRIHENLQGIQETRVTSTRLFKNSKESKGVHRPHELLTLQKPLKKSSYDF